MPFTEIVKIPIFNEIDTTKIVGINPYDSIDDRIALAAASDDFTDEVIGWQWTLNEDIGSSVVESGGVLNIDISSGSGTRIAEYSSQSVEGEGDFEFEVDFANWSHSGVDISLASLRFYISADDNLYCRRDYISATERFASNARIGAVNNTATHITTANSGKLKIWRKGDIVAAYYDEGSGWELLDMVSGFSTAAGVLEIQGSVTVNNTVSFDFDNFIASGGSWHPTDSPSPAQIWEGFPVGSIIDMSTLRIPEIADQPMLYKYAANGGSQSASMTQTNLRLESDIIITDAAQSISIQPILPWSAGNIRPEIAVNALADITFYNKRERYGFYGHRRLA